MREALRVLLPQRTPAARIEHTLSQLLPAVHAGVALVVPQEASARARVLLEDAREAGRARLLPHVAAAAAPPMAAALSLARGTETSRRRELSSHGCSYQRCAEPRNNTTTGGRAPPPDNSPRPARLIRTRADVRGYCKDGRVRSDRMHGRLDPIMRHGQ